MVGPHACKKRRVEARNRTLGLDEVYMGLISLYLRYHLCLDHVDPLGVRDGLSKWTGSELPKPVNLNQQELCQAAGGRHIANEGSRISAHGLRISIPKRLLLAVCEILSVRNGLKNRFQIDNFGEN